MQGGSLPVIAGCAEGYQVSDARSGPRAQGDCSLCQLARLRALRCAQLPGPTSAAAAWSTASPTCSSCPWASSAVREGCRRAVLQAGPRSVCAARARCPAPCAIPPAPHQGPRYARAARCRRQRHPAQVLRVQPDPRDAGQHRGGDGGCGVRGGPVWRSRLLTGCPAPRPPACVASVRTFEVLAAAAHWPRFAPALCASLSGVPRLLPCPRSSAWPPCTPCSTAPWAARSPARPRPRDPAAEPVQQTTRLRSWQSSGHPQAGPSPPSPACHPACIASCPTCIFPRPRCQPRNPAPLHHPKPIPTVILCSARREAAAALRQYAAQRGCGRLPCLCPAHAVGSPAASGCPWLSTIALQLLTVPDPPHSVLPLSCSLAAPTLPLSLSLAASFFLAPDLLQALHALAGGMLARDE